MVLLCDFGCKRKWWDTKILLTIFSGSKWCDDIYNVDTHCNTHQPDHCAVLWCEDVPGGCCHHFILHFGCFVAYMVSALLLGNIFTVTGSTFQNHQSDSADVFVGVSQVCCGTVCPWWTCTIHFHHLPCCDLGTGWKPGQTLHQNTQSQWNLHWYDIDERFIMIRERAHLKVVLTRSFSFSWAAGYSLSAVRSSDHFGGLETFQTAAVYRCQSWSYGTDWDCLEAEEPISLIF